MQVIVLGMHRSGTSLLSSILLDLGVHIGERLWMRGKGQPHGHWEDRDFLDLNKEILHAAGGRWNQPPTARKILQVRGKFNPRIRALIAKKNLRKRWGWKDPRTSLTIPLYVPYLDSARYIRIIRSKQAVMASLFRRHQGGQWGALHDTYIQRVDEFLVDRPHLVTTYSALMNRRTNKTEVRRINTWINGNGRIDAAMERIKHD